MQRCAVGLCTGNAASCMCPCLTCDSASASQQTCCLACTHPWVGFVISDFAHQTLEDDNHVMSVTIQGPEPEHAPFWELEPQMAVPCPHSGGLLDEDVDYCCRGSHLLRCLVSCEGLCHCHRSCQPSRSSAEITPAAQASSSRSIRQIAGEAIMQLLDYAFQPQQAGPREAAWALPAAALCCKTKNGQGAHSNCGMLLY